MSIFHYAARTIRGASVSLDDYRGKVLLIVNVASQCGFTKQYEELQKLYEKHKDEGFAILGFPCNQFGGQEPGTNEEVDTFCQLNYGVTFPMFEKVDVRGPDKHPLFAHLTAKAPFEGFDSSNASAQKLSGYLSAHQPELLAGDEIKWNFTKFLIDRDGNVVKRFEPPVEPFDIEPAVEALL